MLILLAIEDDDRTANVRGQLDGRRAALPLDHEDRRVWVPALRRRDVRRHRSIGGIEVYEVMVGRHAAAPLSSISGSSEIRRTIGRCQYMLLTGGLRGRGGQIDTYALAGI